MKRIIAKQEVCIGCGLCEVHCKVQHSKSKDVIKAYNSERPKPVSRVHVERNKPVSFAVQCHQCDDPVCVTACLSGAMQKDKQNGLVTHNSDKCIGCWTCVMVCPYGAITMDKEGKIAAKCDQCQGLEVPACVANCPNEALVFKEVRT